MTAPSAFPHCPALPPPLPMLIAAAALLLGGCMSLAPSYEAPQAPVAERYAAEDLGRADGGVQAAALAWRSYFTEPRLQRLIAQALENSRDLRSATLRVAEAQAILGIQRADLFPTVAATADGARGRTPADLSPTGRAVTASQYQAGLGLASWELDFWGRVRSLRDAALENYLATDEARRAVSVSLVAQLANAYFALRELDERLALAQQTVANRQEAVRIFTRRFEVGAIARTDLVQTETLLHQAQSLAAQLGQLRALQLHALSLLVGMPLPELAQPGMLDDQAMATELRAGLPSDLLLQRPDILAAEHRLRAAHANIGAARAAFFPRVTLTGAYGTASAEFSGLFDSGSSAWQFMPSLSLPIFDGGRNRASLDLAQVRRNLAVSDYEKTIQSAFREVSDALAARRWLGEQLGADRATLAAQAERARLAQLRYDNGSAPYFEVLDAQRELLSAQQQLVQTRRALLASRVNLYAALGGGSAEFATQPALATLPSASASAFAAAATAPSAP
ncbi:MAG: efflux transporter outer membrane subunit [Burkholderiaceae bacterium]